MASVALTTESAISGSPDVGALESTSQPLFFMTKPEALDIIVDFFNNPVIREQYNFPPNENFPGGSDKFFNDIIAYVKANYTKDYVFSTDTNTILEIESGGGSGMIGGGPEYKCSMLVVWLVIITLILFFWSQAIQFYIATSCYLMSRLEGRDIEVPRLSIIDIFFI